ncbi:MAG: DNA methyltransferase [Pseudomonadota bacterium]|nr:DNA methyltransferase [Pseudomonadota bacterium]
MEIFVPRGKDSLLIDPFAGSGTTLLAAKAFGINYIGIEIEIEYINIIEKRLKDTNDQQEKLAL